MELMLRIDIKKALDMTQDLHKDGSNSKGKARDYLVNEIAAQHCAFDLGVIKKCPIKDFENPEAGECESCWKNIFVSNKIREEIKK